MKKLITLSLASLCLISATIAEADGPYIIGQFGRIYQDNLPNIAGTSRDTIEKFGYHFALGYDQQQQQTYDLGLRLGFGYYGKTIWNNSQNNAAYSHTIYGYDLQTVATYHTNPSFDFMLHGGLALMQDQVVSDFVQSNENHVRPILGLGAAWNFDPNLAATFDYNHLFGNNVSQASFNRQPSLNIYWMGFRYRFNSFNNESQPQ